MMFPMRVIQKPTKFQIVFAACFFLSSLRQLVRMITKNVCIQWIICRVTSLVSMKKKKTLTISQN